MPVSSAEYNLLQEFPAHINALADAGFAFSGSPEILRALPGGYTNQSFLIKDARTDYVLRLANPASAGLGICRDRERTLQGLAANADLAPAHLCCVKELGLDLFEYLSGHTLSPLELRTLVAEAAEVLHTVHRLPATLPPFDYTAHLRTLAGALPGNRVVEAIQTLCTDGTRALVHHDPNPSNWHQANTGLKLIDWEYAANGFAEVDWAGLMVEAELSLAEVACLSGCSEGALLAGHTLYLALGEAWQKRVLLIPAASPNKREPAYSRADSSDTKSPPSNTYSGQTTLPH